MFGHWRGVGDGPFHMCLSERMSLSERELQFGLRRTFGLWRIFGPRLQGIFHDTLIEGLRRAYSSQHVTIRMLSSLNLE